MLKISLARAENQGKCGYGHEYIIDHRRRDILVRRVRFLWAGTLVLNQRHRRRLHSRRDPAVLMFDESAPVVSRRQK
jgi:hypothetical protein